MFGNAREFSAERTVRPLVVWWRARGVLTRDGVVALTLAALAFMPGLRGGGVQFGELPQRQLDVWGVLLGFGQCLPLVARQRWPVMCLALVAGAFSADQMLGYPPSFGSEGLVLALYSGGAYIERYRWGVAVAASAGYLALVFVLHDLGSPERPVDFVTFWMVLSGCWAGGCWMRGRRAGEEERRLHSAQLAVAEERARIARELHDVVTHHVTAMVVQSDAAGFLLPDAPDRVAEGLTAIGRTGRRALVELRYLLDVLDRPQDAERAHREPMPGRVGDLVELVRSAGQPVEFAERGQPRPVHSGVALAAYRVVQEALTNAVKYAPGKRTVVEVAYDDEGIEIDVANEGDAPDVVPVAAVPGSPAIPAGGRGLAGLRERVGVFGGELSAGPRPGGGFHVHTRLPLGDGR